MTTNRFEVIESFREPMSKHSIWGVGGPADHVLWPSSVTSLRQKLSSLPVSTSLTWVGLGSNLLVRDAGIRGTVIITAKGLDGIELIDGNRVRIECGVPCAKVARFAAKSGLGGAEFLIGIPGTIGGALAMNAGCWGSEIWDWVEAVETINRTGVATQRGVSEFVISYRKVIRPGDEWFLSVILRFKTGDSEYSGSIIKDLLRQRAQSQPMGERSCGSVFKNPDGKYAGQLIECSGLKGHRIGSAHVSRKHANFFINDGDATAAQLEALIRFVQKQVYVQTGVLLHEEVQIIGEHL